FDMQYGAGLNNHLQVIPRVFGDARIEAHARELGELAGRRVDGGELQRIRVALVVQDQGQPLVARAEVEQRRETGALRVVVRVEQDIGLHLRQPRTAGARVSVRGKFGQPDVPRGAGAAGEVQRGVSRAAQVQGAIVVDVRSPAHVGEALRVLVVAKIQSC